MGLKTSKEIGYPGDRIVVLVDRIYIWNTFNPDLYSADDRHYELAPDSEIPTPNDIVILAREGYGLWKVINQETE